MFIGFSLSLCVMDILAGRVSESQVALIIAATCFRNEQELEGVISHYQESYWECNPIRGAQIARRLYREGKIFQPRVFGIKPLTLNGKWKEINEWEQAGERIILAVL